MADPKQFVGLDNLEHFWNGVKGYYSTGEDKKVVDNASEAGKLKEARYVKLAGDVTGKASFDGSANAVITASIDIRAIEEHEIMKLFGDQINADDYANMTEAVAAAKNGSTITLSANSLEAMKAAPMTYGTSGQAAFHLEGSSSEVRDLTVNIPEGVELDFSEQALRAFDVRDNATLELTGSGTVKCHPEALNVFLGKNATLIIDGPTFDNAGGEWNISTNGLNANSNVWIKSGTFRGRCYFPGRGYLRIDDGLFECAQGTALYIKNGSPTEINGGTFRVTGCDTSSDAVAGRPTNAWAHNNNGNYGIASAVVVEACNYGGHGNPEVKIVNGNFEPYTETGMKGESYGILVIDWDNNHADMSGTILPYQHVEISGHISSNKGEPADGWVYFGNGEDETVATEAVAL